MKVFPKQLGENILNMLKNLVTVRIKYKREGNSVRAYGLKIAINSNYGRKGQKGSWLRDLAGMYKVTINGQLFLLMAIEALLLENMWVFYSNTN